MNPSWKSDPRLKDMDPAKLSLLSRLADRLRAAPQAEKMNALLSLSQEAAQAGLSFTSEETGLLFSILTEDLSPEEKKRAQLVQTLAAKLHSR